jgi:hypothetical protein
MAVKASLPTPVVTVPVSTPVVKVPVKIPVQPPIKAPQKGYGPPPPKHILQAMVGKQGIGSNHV